MQDRPKILVVDDNEPFLMAVCMLLRKQGHEVVGTGSGLEGLKLAAELRPDLILLDVNLPDVNGKEVLRRIKADPGLSDIFVVHLSAQAGSVEKRLEGLEMGADGYISQPVENYELVARVRAFLRHKKALDALRESESRYRALFESNPAPMWVFDKESLRIVAVNEAAVLHYGYAKGEFAGMHAGSLLADGNEAALRASLQAPAHFGRWPHRKKSGEMIEVETNEQDIEWEGRPSRVVLASDVTERNRVEQERLRQLEHFERELRSLGRLGRPRVAEASQAHEEAPLRERAQPEHRKAASAYEMLLLQALESRVYKTDHNVSNRLRLLAGELFRLKATARDIIEIHYETLRKVAPAPEQPKAQALIETGRLTLIELLGYVLSAYRQFTGALGKETATV